MNTPARLVLYGAGLVALFGGAFLAGGAAVPESVVAAWADQTATAPHTGSQSSTGGQDMGEQDMEEDPVRGISLSTGGLMLGAVTAPTTVGEQGVLRFRVETLDGDAVTAFDTEHDKKLHLIVVRGDGTQFRHVHPTMAADGEWSIPWQWDAAGSYRVYADFTPSSTGASTTLTRTFDVAGDFIPAPAETASRQDEVDGFTVTLDGDLTAGSSAMLTATVSRDGEPVTTLEPYLGAYGHLVALRQGDLAYLHVHPSGEEPTPGSTSGPDVSFMTEVPTPGRYLLYLDFQVDDTVRTARFVLDAAASSNSATDTMGDTPDSTDHSGH